MMFHMVRILLGLFRGASVEEIFYAKSSETEDLRIWERWQVQDEEGWEHGVQFDFV